MLCIRVSGVKLKIKFTTISAYTLTCLHLTIQILMPWCSWSPSCLSEVINYGTYVELHGGRKHCCRNCFLNVYVHFIHHFSSPCQVKQPVTVCWHLKNRLVPMEDHIVHCNIEIWQNIYSKQKYVFMKQFNCALTWLHATVQALNIWKGL